MRAIPERLAVDVDEGNTVTDFLPEERDRGITIQSACIPLAWTPHSYDGTPSLHLINLIDTPGHADFTIEVERSLSVLDGCVVILDGVAGVEAQTAQVWTQANRYNLPRIMVVNKMDRAGADFRSCLEDAESKLSSGGAECPPGTGWGVPVPIQIPAVDEERMGSPGNGFLGVVDLLSMELLTWLHSDSTGSTIVRTSLMDVNGHNSSTTGISSDLVSRALEAREHLVDLLTGHDDRLVEVFLSPEVDGDASRIPAAELAGAIRRTTLAGSIVPVLAAASLRNLGVQPVMDAAVYYLPGANARENEETKPAIPRRDEPAIALAFKVVHDSRRGFLTYVRVFSGTIEKQQLYNQTVRATSINSVRSLPERPSRILQPYGGDFEEVPSLSSGHIAALTGFRNVFTGDILTSVPPGKSTGKNRYPINFPPRIFVPPPVYFASVEPRSASDEKPLAEALEILTREDPSISWRVDEESGQWIVGGMGALHLEVVGNRLRDRFGVSCEVGKVRVGYRERVSLVADERKEVSCDWERIVLGKKQRVEVRVEIRCVERPHDREDASEGRDIAPYTPTAELTDQAQSSSSGRRRKDREGDSSSNSQPLQYHTHHPDADENLVILPADPLNLFVSTDGPFSKLPIPGYPPLSDLIDACVRGARVALLRGPLMGAQLRESQVFIKSVTLYSPELSTISAVRSAVSRAVSDTLAAAGTRAMEPVADLEVTCRAGDVGVISRDLTGVRSGNILEIRDGSSAGTGGRSVVKAVVPLAEMSGYLSSLRSLSGGTASMGVRVKGYEVVQGEARTDNIVKEVSGL
ncbi:Ribosome-releasing factor 2, mitochondrial [Gonapodya sp. JEL0774]|nr:Ribosome-releasing factor 2, mitochondrial [Gonapodya sp. JEL0774]